MTIRKLLIAICLVLVAVAARAERWVPKDSTDKSIRVVLTSSATGAPATGLTVTDIDVYVWREGATVTAKFDCTDLGSENAAHSNTGCYEGGALGIYRIDLPDTAWATGADYVDISVVHADCVTAFVHVALTGVDPNDSTPAVDVTEVSGDATAANNLEAILDGTGVASDVDIQFRSLTINNDAGTGVEIDGTTHGMDIAASAGVGIEIDGTSYGIDCRATAGNALYCGGGGVGNGILAYAAGTGDGIGSLAAAGRGLAITAVSGDYEGVEITGSGDEPGVKIRGGADNANGVEVSTQGSGTAISLAGGLTGHGIWAKGGATSGHGIYAYSTGVGHGILATGGLTSGDGFHAEAATLGDGIEATAAGALMYDINADIHGTLDTVTTCTDMRGTDNAALAAMALSNVQWTDARAAKLDYLTGNAALATALATAQADLDDPDQYKADVTAVTATSTPDLLLSTTVATVTDQTHLILTAGSDDDDAYNGATVVICDVSNNNYPTIRRIKDYAGATKTITLNVGGVFTVAGSDTVKVFAFREGSMGGP